MNILVEDFRAKQGTAWHARSVPALLSSRQTFHIPVSHLPHALFQNAKFLYIAWKYSLFHPWI